MGGDVSTQLNGTITMDTSDAQEGLSNFNDYLNQTESIISGIIGADILETIAGQIEDIGAAAFTSAGQLQNIGVNMQYAFGSQADNMTQALNKLQTQLPETNIQIEQTAVALKNAGESNSDIIKSISSIGDITSATSKSFSDIANNAQSVGQILANAFNRGTIQSRQLLQLNQQMPGLYAAITQEINKLPLGLGSVESVKATQTQTNAVATATQNLAKYKAEMQTDQEQLQILQQNLTNNGQVVADYQTKIQNATAALNLLGQEHVYGAINVQKQQDAINSAQESLTSLQQGLAKAQDTSSQTEAIQKEQTAIANLSDEITKAGTTIQEPAEYVKATIGDLTSTTTAIQIPASVLKNAINDVGGKYAGAANAQLNTLNGTLDLLKKGFTEVGQGILGFDAATNTVVKGGAFDSIQNAAKTLLGFLNDNKAAIISFGQYMVSVFTQQVAPSLEQGFSWILSHKQEIAEFAEELIKDFGAFTAYMIKNGLPMLEGLAQDFIKLEPLIQVVLDLLGKLSDIVSFLASKGNALNAAGSSLYGGLPGGLIGSISHFASGTDSAPGGLALVGENGPELVNLPQGSSVSPTGQGAGTTSVVINNPTVQNEAMLQQMINQITVALGRQNYLAKLGAI